VLPWKRQKQHVPGRFINGNSGGRKMNKNKEKKRELTHFLGHYLEKCTILSPIFKMIREVLRN